MDLYHSVSIGNLTLGGNLFLAPIAGYSDRAFRSLCIECGASFCTTEMVSAEALTRGSEKTESLMARSPVEKEYAVQIFGGNADVMERAVPIVLARTKCSAIDINGGCPVPKIVKSGAGSMLTKEPDRLYSIVKAVKNAAGTVPVTVKIRSGWDSQHLTWKEAAEAALSAGADGITIHARTRAQGYEGKADWEIQRMLVEYVNGRIPVFGSGDAHTPETARKMLEETGVDGVMFARGAMGDPFLFTRTKQYLIEGRYEEVSVKARLLAGFRELDMNIADKGEKQACLQMRKKFCAYSSGIRGGAKIRQSVVNACTKEDYLSIFNSYLV
ncbi:MAG: tRNA dihydrouridine synthase DusB [Treponema sp.]|nr:tRNA dihydrouridine synthase DusB [Treponema sp.]